MKKLILGATLILYISSAMSGTDVKDKPSGFYIDEDVYNGKVHNSYHSQLMDQKAYKQHLLFAVDSILSDYCLPTRFVNEAYFVSDNPVVQKRFEKQKKNLNEEEKFCSTLENVSINSIEKKLSVIDRYKEFTCNRNISDEVNSQSAKMTSEYKENYLLNCLSNPKELTIKELLDYNTRTAYNETGYEPISITDGVLGTLPPSNQSGFNFGESSEPPAGVWNFDQDKEASEFDNISIEEALTPKAIRF
jgi:hypothetical protein